MTVADEYRRDLRKKLVRALREIDADQPHKVALTLGWAQYDLTVWAERRAGRAARSEGEAG